MNADVSDWSGAEITCFILPSPKKIEERVWQQADNLESVGFKFVSQSFLVGYGRHAFTEYQEQLIKIADNVRLCTAINFCKEIAVILFQS